ncbi:fatty acid synthase-like [Oppia nitens]|uniref:fatty acid synthase-like n=1 Tax=Oppia nitens TaxID=1686743 RepID=UPI0023DCD214|nr:fatty acid synthase-like [Oppia nitens]
MSKTLNDQIVISGMSGRFPQSDTIDEFAENLYNGTDMISDDNPRWPKGLYDMNSRMGKLKTYDRFDITFFGLMEKMCHEIDPQSRLLLEVTYEAIIDAGINPDSLRGTRTGVYIGVASYAASDGYAEELQPDIITQKDSVFLQNTGNMKSMFANRVSFVFDFKGPSMIVDTACSSSLTAFNLAINDLRLGNVDYAIVGGTHMTFDPYVLQMAQESGICSPTGRSSVMDEYADGMVKADTVVALLLQRGPGARRVYASVLTSRVNCDGRKTIGMFHPSSEDQYKLMVMAYTEANIDPLKLTYFEGHLTGTKAGDPEEIRSIFRAYCEKPDRRQPLLVGSLKSNMGHAEGGSGLASLIKVLLAFENECIPRNINLNKLRHELRLYCPPISPVTSNMPYKPGMAAINNFGLGGVNAHLLVEPNYKIRSISDDDCLSITDTIPRIVNICGRTEDSVKHIMDFIEQNPKKITKDFLALLGEIMKYSPNVNSSGFPYRGNVML